MCDNPLKILRRKVLNFHISDYVKTVRMRLKRENIPLFKLLFEKIHFDVLDKTSFWEQINTC